MSRRYNTEHITDDKVTYMRNYMREYNNRKRDKEIEKNRESVPKEERCDDYYDLWNMIYDEVLYYWDDVENAYVLKK